MSDKTAEQKFMDAIISEGWSILKAAEANGFTVEQGNEIFDRLTQQTRTEQAQTVAQIQHVKPDVQLPAWQTLFRTVDQLEDGDVTEYVKGIIPEGITFIGALAGVCKTWFALSIARSLTTGEKLFGIYDVPEQCNVLYLTPEVGDKALKKRCKKLRIPTDGKFWCQTVKDCFRQLDNRVLEAAIAELKPVVILDTAIRFNPSADENSSSQNAKLLAGDLFDLRRWGAKAVICLHHSPKYSGEAEFMTLENVLRGTGDIGAMCDAVWGIQHDKRRLPDGKTWDWEYFKESQRLTRVYVKCVKPRDFDPVEPFRIQGRPYVDERGTFVVLAEAEAVDIQTELITTIASCPTHPMRMLLKRFGIGQKRAEKMASVGGWFWDGHEWSKETKERFGPQNPNDASGHDRRSGNGV